MRAQGGYEDTGFAIGDGFGDASDGGSDNGDATGLGFDGGDAEGLRLAGFRGIVRGVGGMSRLRALRQEAGIVCGWAGVRGRFPIVGRACFFYG